MVTGRGKNSQYSFFQMQTTRDNSGVTSKTFAFLLWHCPEHPEFSQLREVCLGHLLRFQRHAAFSSLHSFSTLLHLFHDMFLALLTVSACVDSSLHFLSFPTDMHQTHHCGYTKESMTRTTQNQGKNLS